MRNGGVLNPPVKIKPEPESKRERQSRYRAERRAAGKCANCGGKRDRLDRAYCAVCRKATNERKSGVGRRSSVLYRRPLRSTSEYELKQRVGRRANGVCTRCGGERDRSDRFECAGCRDSHRAFALRQRAAGKCVRCSAKSDTRLCRTCVLAKNVPRRARALYVIPPGFEPRTGVPTSRQACKDGPRPCEYVRCEHHLWMVTGPERQGRRHDGRAPGSIVRAHSPATCTLDVVEAVDGGARVTVEQMATMLGVTDRRVRYMLAEAKAKVGADVEVGDAFTAFVEQVTDHDDVQLGALAAWKNPHRNRGG